MFYDQLSPICKEKGTSVSAVLDALGMSRANIARWKKGVNPKFEVKLRIADHLKIDVQDLLSESERQYRSSDMKNAPSEESAMNEREEYLLKLFRDASSEAQEMVLRALGK